MKCTRVRGLFSRYLENDLDEKTRRQIEQHLDECSECQKEYKTFSHSLRIMHAADKFKLPK